MNISNFIQELKRRNVFKVATAYAIAGWLIIQVIDTISPQLGFPEWIPPFITVFVLVGFPLALIFAWAFELTPDGIKKSKEVDITESVTNNTGKKLNGIIITVLSMGLIFLLVERVFFAEASFIENQSELADIETASIAVLPFVNMSGDTENEYFSDGLSEELLNALAKVEDMKVAGRTSSFKFKGQNEDLKLVGEQLGVGHILEGSVRKSGGRVRITAQLIKVTDGFHMWSETFDRELTANNVFEIQEEISRKVLTELKVRLLDNDEAELVEIPTQDIEAYQAYLKGNQLTVNRNFDEIEAAIELYKDAIRIDPSFADAYGKLALAYNAQAYYGNIPMEEMLENVLTNAEKALEINKNSFSAHAAMGHYYTDTNQPEKALSSYKRSLEINPNFTDVYNWLGNYYGDLADPENQFATYRKGYEVDPLNPLAIYNRARVSIYEEDYDEMEEFIQKNIRINPDFIPTYFLRGNIKSSAPFGNIDQAFKDYYKTYQLDSKFPRAISSMTTISLVIGNLSMAEYFLDNLRDNYNDSFEYRSVLGLYGKYSGDFSYLEEVNLPFLQESEFVPLLDGPYFDLYDYALITGNMDKVLPFFRKFDATLFSDTLTSLSQRNATKASLLSLLLQRSGDEGQATLLAKLYCGFTEDSWQEYPKGKDDLSYLFDELSCAYNNYDFDLVLEKLKTLYEEHHDVIAVKNILVDVKDNYSEYYTEGHKELFDTVSEDLDKQKKNIEDFLKAEGEWKEEWEEGN
jgi:TolB-like protein/Tfp pilus assembly protein PilF